MSEGRDIYHEPKQKVLLRTADVYQTEVDDEVAGYSDKLLAIVADYHNGGRPEGMNAQAMVGKSKRGEVAFRLFGRINPETRVIEAAGFKTRGCLAMTGCACRAASNVRTSGRRRCRSRRAPPHQARPDRPPPAQGSRR